MIKARFRGVPNVLERPPFLSLPLPKNLPFNTEKALAEVAYLTELVFQKAPFRFRFFSKRKCLLRGMVVIWFARRLNSEVILHFGMKKVNDGVKAHCWLTLLNHESAETESDSGYQEVWKFKVTAKAQA